MMVKGQADDCIKAASIRTNNSNNNNNNIKWYFNPPLAPHFGGVYESLIQATIRTVSAILGNFDIMDEELNSRPLRYQTANLCDDILTIPNHSLHGKNSRKVAIDSVGEEEYHPNKR